ncbi:unnamed protein product, partial [Rotaria magnacalcarata]
MAYSEDESDDGKKTSMSKKGLTDELYKSLRQDTRRNKSK